MSSAMQAAAGEGHHACPHLLSVWSLGNICQTQASQNWLAACDMPGMTEQADLTHLEEQWQPGSQLDSGLCEDAAGKG